MAEPSGTLAIKHEEELLEAQQQENGAGPSGLKRAEPGATKAPKKQRQKSLGPLTAECVLRAVDTITLAVRLPCSMPSDPTKLTLKYKAVNATKGAANADEASQKKPPLEFGPANWTLEGSTIFVVLPDLQLSRSYSITELQVTDAQGSSAKAKAESGTVAGCADLRPSLVLATNEQLQNACKELRKVPAAPGGRRELLKKLLDEVTSDAQVRRLCDELGVQTKMDGKAVLKGNLIVQIVATAQDGPEAARAAIVQAAKEKEQTMCSDADSARRDREQATATVAASEASIGKVTADADSAEKQMAKAATALEAAQRKFEEAEEAHEKAKGAKEEAVGANQTAIEEEQEAKDRLRAAQEKHQLAQWVATKTETAAVGIVSSTVAVAPPPTDMPKLGSTKLSNLIKKGENRWLNSLKIDELKPMKKALMGSEAGNKERLVEDIVNSTKAPQDLAKALVAATGTLRDSAVGDLYRKISEVKELKGQCPAFPGKQPCLDWVVHMLRAVPTRGGAPAPPAPPVPQPQQQTSTGSAGSAGSSSSVHSDAGGRRKRPEPFELLIVACSPKGLPALPEVKREAHELQQLVSDSTYETAASATDLQKLLGTVPTKRFLFCGHADAALNHGNRTLAFTSPTDGQQVLVEPTTLSTMMGGIHKRGLLELVFLNGCNSRELGQAVADAGVPNVVCWESATCDGAAKLFSMGFFEAIQQSINQNQEPSYSSAFALARSQVLASTRVGKDAKGKPAQVPRYELRAPELVAVAGGGVKDVSETSADYTPKPIAAGLPVLLHPQPGALAPPPPMKRAKTH